MIDFKNREWCKFNNKSFFPDIVHLWFTKKEIFVTLFNEEFF